MSGSDLSMATDDPTGDYDAAAADLPAPGTTWGLDAVRQWRAVHDPVVIPDDAQAGADFAPEHLHDSVIEARVERAETTPTDERIEKATWPEVSLWCMVASTNARYVSRKFVAVYTVAFEHTTPDGMEIPGLAGSSPVEPGDDAREAADELRTRIREAQNRAFVSEQYGELPIDTTAVTKARFK